MHEGYTAIGQRAYNSPHLLVQPSEPEQYSEQRYPDRQNVSQGIKYLLH